MGYLDDAPERKLFNPKPRDLTDEERAQKWQNEGHRGISEDFSDMKTPQELEDNKKQNV